MNLEIVLIGLVLIALGLLFILRGKEIMQILVPVLGFLVGFSIASAYLKIDVYSLLVSQNNFLSVWYSLLFPIIVGLVFAIVAVIFTRLGISLIVANIVYSLVYFTVFFLSKDEAVSRVFSFIIAVMVFVASLLTGFYRNVIISITSLYGGYLVALGFILLILLDKKIINVILSNDVRALAFTLNFMQLFLFYLIWGIGTWFGINLQGNIRKK